MKDPRVPRCRDPHPETPDPRRGAGSRRSFLAAAAAAFAFPAIVPARTLGLGEATPPSSRLGVAVIGTGSRGMNHVDAFSANPRTRVVGVSDPYRSKRLAARAHVEARAGAGSCADTHDFRELLERRDVDLVAIASPENWHAIQASLAVKAGKDVYCEKALSLTVHEGRGLVDTVRRHGRVLQVGLQQRSDGNFRLAAELARNGHLGRLRTVKVGVPGGRVLPVAEAKDPPADLDYEMWLGPAAWTPYNDLKCTFNWYFMRDTCAGWIESWGVHHVDAALWGAPALARGTVEVEGSAVFPEEGMADTSVTWSVEWTTEDGLKLSFTDNGRNEQGCRFEGESAWVHVDRGSIRASDPSILRTRFRASDERLPVSRDHHEDFIDAVLSRRDPVASVEDGHAATTLTLVSDIACRLGRKLRWDWGRERFTPEGEANRLLHRSLRAPWIL